MSSLGSCTWAAPTPLRGAFIDPPGLMLDHVFPPACKWAGDYCAALAANLQVDPGMVAPMALSLASLAVTKAVEYQARPGHIEVPPIWTMTLGAPGALKSPVLRSLLAPYRRPAMCGSDMLPPPPAFSKPTVWDPDDDDEDDGDAPRSKPAVTESDPAATEVPEPPRRFLGIELLAHDLTPVAAAHVASRLGERLGIVSDEGHFIAMLERSVFGGGVDLYLKGWSGDSLILRRVKESIVLHAPEVVVALLVQPGVAGDLLTAKPLVERGIPQRFLYSAPARNQVVRPYGDAVALPVHLAAAWDARVRGLLAIPRQDGAAKMVLRLSPAAMTAYAAFATQMTEARHSDVHAPLMREWYAKAHGQALRIAGILTMLGSEAPTEIGVEEVTAAIAWVEYFAAHTAAVILGQGADDRSLYHAQRVLTWLKAQGQTWVSRNAIAQALRCRDLPRVSAWTPIFTLLEDRHYLRPSVVESSQGRGGRPSQGFDVNPKLFAHTENPRNPGNSP